MDILLTHINEHKFVYTMLLTLMGFAALWWLSRFFATKKELQEQREAIERHQFEFGLHKKEHFQLREMVLEINSHIKHLPTAAETAAMKEEMALLRGRLEGTEPLLKQILNNQNILIENELRGDKS
ncbi:DUF2730 family protein [Glaciecola sp. 1036]|uniref:DUF2730 family protein n=1 Tax=Alteromonadaceae TaxID=72275 RepID=UPI003D0223D1